MLILQTIRASTEASHTVRQEQWRGNLKGTPDTRGLVVGIIGMGNIGKVGRSWKCLPTALTEGDSSLVKRFKVRFSLLFVAFTAPHALAALGMKVIYHNRCPLPLEGLSLAFHLLMLMS